MGQVRLLLFHVLVDFSYVYLKLLNESHKKQYIFELINKHNVHTDSNDLRKRDVLHSPYMTKVPIPKRKFIKHNVTTQNAKKR